MVIVNKTRKTFGTWDCVAYSAMFLILLFSCGFAINGYNGTLILAVEATCILTLLLACLLTRKLIKVSVTSIIYLFSIVLLILIGEILRGGSFKHVQISVYAMIMAYGFACCFSFDEFMRKYTNLMYFLCAYSVILYVLYLMMPSIVEKLPVLTNSNGIRAYTAGFSTIYAQYNGVRNQGIFWEPGAYQMFINLAMLIELFYFKTLYKKHLFVFLITLFTTFSTAGYITAFFLLYTYVMWILFDKTARNKQTALLIFYLMSILLILYLLFELLDLPVMRELFGKIERYFDGGPNTGSVDVRIDAFIKPLKAVIREPLWGLGYIGSINLAYTEGYRMETCTFVNWFSYYGIVVGGMILNLYVKFVKKLQTKGFIRVLLFFSLFSMTFSENFARNVFFLSLGFLALLEVGKKAHE